MSPTMLANRLGLAGIRVLFDGGTYLGLPDTDSTRGLEVDYTDGYDITGYEDGELRDYGHFTSIDDVVAKIVEIESK